MQKFLRIKTSGIKKKPAPDTKSGHGLEGTITLNDSQQFGHTDQKLGNVGAVDDTSAVEVDASLGAVDNIGVVVGILHHTLPPFARR
jgi:hypothetical protein